MKETETVLRLHLQNCKTALEQNGFHVDVVETQEELLRLVDHYVKDGDLVCDGGSMTLQESGVIEHLGKRNIQFTSHNDPSLSRKQSDEEARKAFYADVFFASANAITEQGEIINVDGHGNRVSAMIFGPKKVILVAGWNKIVKDEEAAHKRIKDIAAPANCVRLHKETPCVHTGSCMNCHCKDRICSSYVKLNYDKEQRIHIILVKQAYGF